MPGYSGTRSSTLSLPPSGEGYEVGWSSERLMAGAIQGYDRRI